MCAAVLRVALPRDRAWPAGVDRACVGVPTQPGGNACSPNTAIAEGCCRPRMSSCAARIRVYPRPIATLRQMAFPSGRLLVANTSTRMRARSIRPSDGQRPHAQPRRLA